MDENSKKNFFKDKNFWVGLIVGVVVIAVVLLVAFSVQAMMSGGLSVEKAKTTVTKYVNTELLGGQATATLDQITDWSKDIYKLKFTINGRSIDSYMTKNGKLFFPEAYEMASTTASSTATAATANTAQQAAPANVPKNDKPKVEAFVMSYCPYGTQIEKGLIPVAQALGNKIDFSLKFVSYTMHGDKENQENLRQYCIEKEQNGKYFSYLTCFLKASDSPGCLQSTGIDQKKLDACTTATAKQFDVTGTNFAVQKADNDKYGVQGSPTLVINGAQAESARDSASLLKTICGAFNKQPDICTTAKLSSASPSAGFGEGTAPASSGAAAAGCATN